MISKLFRVINFVLQTCSVYSIQLKFICISLFMIFMHIHLQALLFPEVRLKHASEGRVKFLNDIYLTSN